MRSVLAAMLLVPLGAAAQACPAAPPGAKLLDSPRYSAGFRTQPDRISVGQHFAVELAVCPKDGARAPDSVRVDAHMPEHRHGMNYKANVAAVPGGRYRAEGLMFHMPGRWEFVFDVRAGDRTDRLTHSIVLE